MTLTAPAVENIGGENIANQQTVRRGPRRQIEKVDNVVVIPAVTQAVIEDILHEAERSETLVRAIVDLHITALLDPLAVFSWSLQVAPKGTIVNTPTTGESLDREQANTDILNGTTNTTLGTSTATYRRFQVDSSGMRKLKKGDEIVLQTTCNPTNSVALAGTVKLFFKE